MSRRWLNRVHLCENAGRVVLELEALKPLCVDAVDIGHDGVTS